jgi:hypothetical protein
LEMDVKSMGETYIDLIHEMELDLMSSCTLI